MLTTISNTPGIQANGLETTTPADREQTFQQLMKQFSTDGRAQLAFGEPMKIGERTLIPVARISYVFGGGYGRGTSPTRTLAAEGEAAPRAMPDAFGSGGIGAMRVQPISIVEVSADGVEVRPFVEVQAIVTRAFGFAGVVLLVGLVLGARARRRLPALQIGKIQRLGSPQVWLRLQRKPILSFM